MKMKNKSIIIKINGVKMKWIKIIINNKMFILVKLNRDDGWKMVMMVTDDDDSDLVVAMIKL